MSEILSQIATEFDAQLQLAFIVFCAFLLLTVFYLPARRRRLQKKRSTLRRKSVEFEPDPMDEKLGARMMKAMHGPGSGAMLHLLVILGTATCALIGWRIPAEIERIYGDGAGFGLIFPNVTMPTIGKLAQVIGAATFGACSLRMLQLLVPLMFVLVLVLLALLAVQYVTGISILGVMGT